MAAKKRQQAKSGERRSYVGMMLVTVFCLIAGFFLLKGAFFSKPTTDTKEGNTSTEAIEGQPSATDVEESKSATATVTSSAPTSIRTSPKPPAAPEGAQRITFEEANFYPTSVGSAENRDGYTAVFCDRGAVLAVVRYETAEFHEDGVPIEETRKPVFVESPVEPTEDPQSDSPDHSLLLIGPWFTQRTWRKNNQGEFVAIKKGDDPLNAPERKWALNDKGEKVDKTALLKELFNGNQLMLPDGSPSERTLAFSFATKSTEIDWRNEVRWECSGLSEQAENGSRNLTFTSPADADGVVIKKHFTIYPNFKIVCNIELSRSAPEASAEESEGNATDTKPVKRALNISGAPGIRQDMLATGIESERVALEVLYGDLQGYVFDEDRLTARSLSDELADYWEDNPDRANTFEIPAHELFEPDDGHSVMLSGSSNGYFVAALGLDYLPKNKYADWEGNTGADILFPPRNINPERFPEKKVFRLLPPSEWNTGMSFNFPAVSLMPGGSVERRLAMYVGPRDDDHIVDAFELDRPTVANDEGEQEPDPGMRWTEFTNISYVPALSRPISALFGLLNSWIGSVAISIIFLTIVIRLAMSPLSWKGQKSMQIHGSKMRKIKPKLDEIRAKYKDNRSREAQMLLFQEQRALMKNAGVSMFPLGGCLPLLLQFPIFIALYYSVRASFLLRHEHFLWIEDLSRPDALFGSIPSSMMFLSAGGFITFNLLPIIWVALFVIQQKLQPKPTDPQQAKMQKMMMIIMPVMMGGFFYAMPAGFTLYFVASSIYSFCEIRLVKWRLRSQGLIDDDREEKPKVTIEPA